MIRVAIVMAVLAATSIASAQVEHALPVRFSRRPLTLTQGTFRIDNALVFDVRRGMELNAPNQLSIGLTDDVEIGVLWPYFRDPTFAATARFGHSDVIDAGFSVAVTTPLITNGVTNLALSLPLVFRLGDRVRILTGFTAEFLLAQTMQPLLRFPLQFVVNATERHYFGLQGYASLVDRRYWHGEIGFIFGHTAAATPIRPIGEIRVGATYLFEGGFQATLAFSFFPTVLPTSSQRSSTSQ
jgi:hypothetical protein